VCEPNKTSPPRVIWEERVALAQLGNKFPLVTMGRPKFIPKLPLPFDDHHPNLIHPSLDRPHSPSQAASGSNQPFCHSTLSGHRQTDRPTDGLGDRSTPSALTLAILIESDALIIGLVPCSFFDSQCIHDRLVFTSVFRDGRYARECIVNSSVIGFATVRPSSVIGISFVVSHETHLPFKCYYNSQHA